MIKTITLVECATFYKNLKGTLLGAIKKKKHNSYFQQLSARGQYCLGNNHDSYNTFRISNILNVTFTRAKKP